MQPTQPKEPTKPKEPVKPKEAEKPKEEERSGWSLFGSLFGRSDTGKKVYKVELPKNEVKPYYDEAKKKWIIPGMEEEEEKAFAGLKKRVVEDEAFEEENTVVERELFFDEKPLYDVFFTLVLGRCQDIVISIRGEATHVVYVVPCDG